MKKYLEAVKYYMCEDYYHYHLALLKTFFFTQLFSFWPCDSDLVQLFSSFSDCSFSLPFSDAIFF